MKRFLIFFFLSLFFIQSVAQNNDVKWFTNLDKAQKYAATNNKNILMVFSGSDWCKPCMQFKKDILEAEDFKKWAKDNLVILYLDFPARKKNKLSKEQTASNEKLADKYNKSGAFPKIILLNSNKKTIATPTFKHQTPHQFIKELKKN